MYLAVTPCVRNLKDLFRLRSYRRFGRFFFGYRDGLFGSVDRLRLCGRFRFIRKRYALPFAALRSDRAGLPHAGVYTATSLTPRTVRASNICARVIHASWTGHTHALVAARILWTLVCTNPVQTSLTIGTFDSGARVNLTTIGPAALPFRTVAQRATRSIRMAVGILSTCRSGTGIGRTSSPTAQRLVLTGLQITSRR